MRRFRALIAGLTIAIGLSATVPAAAENVLRWASVGGALTFDPLAYDERQPGQAPSSLRAADEFDADLKLVPGLAIAWRLVGPTTWEVELRPNVRFHDGTPFTAHDVVFSFRRAKADLPAGFADYVESIADVQATGEHTVRFETFPNPQLSDQLSTSASCRSFGLRRTTPSYR